MAQVKVQTSAPLAGPGLTPGVPPAAMASPGPLGLQPSVNGTGPAPTPACPAPAVGYGDAPVSATSPGRLPRSSGGAAKGFGSPFFFFFPFHSRQRLIVCSKGVKSLNRQRSEQTFNLFIHQDKHKPSDLSSCRFDFISSLPPPPPHPPRRHSTNKQPLAGLGVAVSLLTRHDGLFCLQLQPL